MPKIINSGTNPNVIKLEPSPYKKCSIKVKMEVLNVAGGSPKYTTLANGEKKYHTKSKEPKNLTRLPGTVVEYCASLSRNGLLTGLDEIVENPYKDLDFYKPGWENILKGNKKIRRQELLEYKHNKDRGHYTSQVSDTSASKSISSLSYNFLIQLEPTTKCLLVLLLNITDEYFKFCLLHPQIFILIFSSSIDFLNFFNTQLFI